MYKVHERYLTPKRRETYHRLFQAQSKEITHTMLQFTDKDYVIKIVKEDDNYITCVIKDRETFETQHEIRFIKKNKEGVVWTFMKGRRMSFIAFEHDHPDVINYQ